MTHDATAREVVSGGLRLCVREHSPWAPGKQSVVLVHGFPDQQDVWDEVVGHLDLDALHVVSYDVRGAGGSEAPTGPDGYRTELLLRDLAAVVEATVPGNGRVHLVGHDWGSVQLWDAVSENGSDRLLQGRVASFTSVSGPSLDHAAGLAHGQVSRTRRLRQTAHSWYVYAFHVPVLPELVWRHGHRWLAALMTWGERGQAGHWGPELSRNAVNGLGLYRANVLRRMRRPRALRTRVPVLVVQPRRDRYVTEVLLEGLDECCSDLTVRHVDAGHWVLRSHPAQLAGLVSEHVRSHPG